MAEVALIGNGYLGKAYHHVFPEAYVYDEPQMEQHFGANRAAEAIELGRRTVNKCDIAIIAVPTDPLPGGELDMSIIEDVVSWADTPTILIKSALMPGTVDRLVKETGKHIAVSVEYIGMGNYYMPPEKYPDATDPRKHRLLVVGGEEPARSRAAEILWSKMSPDTRIHLVTAKEAEMVKLLENAWGAFKVTWANCFYNLVTKGGGNYINAHQAWSEDGRVDAMHTRVVSDKRGWTSHCYSKDIPALAEFARQIGATDMQRLIEIVMELNEGHLNENSSTTP